MSLGIDWLKAIQLKPRFLFGLWLVGALVLFLPNGPAQTFGINDLRNSYRPWIGLATIVSFAFWLVQLIPEWRSFTARRNYRKELIRALHSISPEERVVLAYCLECNQQTITLSIADRIAGSLAARGILERASGVGNQLAWPHTIPTMLWDFLQNNRDEFLGAPPFPADQVEARLRGLHQHIHRHDY